MAIYNKNIHQKQNYPYQGHNSQNSHSVVKNTESGAGILGIGQAEETHLRPGLTNCQISANPELAQLVKRYYHNGNAKYYEVPFNLR